MSRTLWGSDILFASALCQGDKLETAIIYPNCATTEIRSRLRLRSTLPGANNRLDVESIMSYDRGDGVLTPVLGEMSLIIHILYCLVSIHIWS